MNQVSKLTTAAALLGVFAFAAAAEAGQVTSADGPVRVNGNRVTIDASNPLTLNEGDVLESLDATVSWRSDGGDDVRVEPQSVIRAEGLVEDVDHLFLAAGSAYGTVSDRTTIGGAAGWAAAAAGQSARIFVHVPAEFRASRTTFRAISGGSWVRYTGEGASNSFRTWIPEQHSVTFGLISGDPEGLIFRTAQQNTGDVEVIKVLGAGEISVKAPKATVGRFSSAPDDKTRIENDISSLKTGKLELATKFADNEPQTAALGPGTYALIDNTTGTIEVSFTAVEFVILDRAVSLASEFATLAQSNFSDVGTRAAGRR